MSDLRVLVVDDHPLFRIGVGTLPAAEPGIEVAGEAVSGAEAVEAADALRPDVVVMDLHLPDLSGIQATRHIVAANPGTGVLMLTMADESESVFAAMRAVPGATCSRTPSRTRSSAPSGRSPGGRPSSARTSRTACSPSSTSRRPASRCSRS